MRTIQAGPKDLPVFLRQAKPAVIGKLSADAECQSYGAIPDSDAYVQCRLAIDVRKANAEAAAEQTRN